MEDTTKISDETTTRQTHGSLDTEGVGRKELTGSQQTVVHESDQINKIPRHKKDEKKEKIKEGKREKF